MNAATASIRKIVSRDIAASVAVVSALNALIAFAGDHHSALGRLAPADRASLFGRLMTGPVCLWNVVRVESVLAQILLFVPTSLALFSVVAYSASRRSRGVLVAASVIWLIAGYFFAVAIWI